MFNIPIQALDTGAGILPAVGAALIRVLMENHDLRNQVAIQAAQQGGQMMQQRVIGGVLGFILSRLQHFIFWPLRLIGNWIGAPFDNFYVF